MTLTHQVLAASIVLAAGFLTRADACATPPSAKASGAEASSSQSEKDQRITESYKDFGGAKDPFSCSVPADWRQTRDEHDDLRSHTFGVLLSGPADVDGAAPTISLRYYGPGNPTAETAEAYLKRQTRPSLVAPKDEETSKTSDVIVAGLKARTFTRKTSEFVNPDTLDAKSIPTRQDIFVVPDTKGYFVLRFSAPVSSFDKWKMVFQKVRDTFKKSEG